MSNTFKRLIIRAVAFRLCNLVRAASMRMEKPTAHQKLSSPDTRPSASSPCLIFDLLERDSYADTYFSNVNTVKDGYFAKHRT